MGGKQDMKIELWWVSWPEVYSSKKQKKQMEKKYFIFNYTCYASHFCKTVRKQNNDFWESDLAEADSWLTNLHVLSASILLSFWWVNQ